MEDADNAPGRTLLVGTAITWTYQVFNTGTVAVAVESLRDDAGTPTDGTDDFTPAAVLQVGFDVGDTDRDNLLDVSEVWLYRATGTALAGQYTNIGRVTVADPSGPGTATASDPANYLGIQPEVQVVKAVNAVNPLAPKVTEDANDPATPVVVPAGSMVVFTYAVSNPGSDALKSVTLLDDNGTPGIGADDFAPAAVTVKYKGKTYNTGDADHDGILDKGETWLFSATRAVGTGAYANVATVSAVNTRTNLKVVDDDPANVFGAVLGIDIETAINAADPSRPTAAEDADDPSRPVVVFQDQPLTWTYLLTNTGNEALSVTSMVDDADTPGNLSDDFVPAAVLDAGFNIGDSDRDGLLDLGEVWRYTSAGTSAGSAAARLGLHTNSVTVVGGGERIASTVSDVDTASYLGEPGLVRIEKAINAVYPQSPTRYEDAELATGPILQVGTPVVWTYQVFNLGDAALSIVDITDSDGFMPRYLGGDVDGDLMLGPDEVWLFSSQGVNGVPTVAAAGQQANTVSVKATDDAGNLFTDDDQAHYLGMDSGTNAAIGIVKSINATDPRNPTAREDANDPLNPVVLQQVAIPIFTYQVRNLGVDALKDIAIMDDAASDQSGDDFPPLAVTVKYKDKQY